MPLSFRNLVVSGPRLLSTTSAADTLASERVSNINNRQLEVLGVQSARASRVVNHGTTSMQLAPSVYQLHVDYEVLITYWPALS